MKRGVIIALSLLLASCSGGDDSGKGGVGTAQNAPQQQVVQQQGMPPQAGVRQAAVFQSVSAAQADELIKKKPNLLILDVRSPQELVEGKIKNSLLVPFWDIAKGQYQPPADMPLLVVCAVGGRSYAVAQYLNKKGYPEVYNLSGGMSAWKNAGMPVVYGQ